MPLSVTVKRSFTRPRAARDARTSSRTAPRSVNFTALSIRFSIAARNRAASPMSISGRSAATVTSTVRPLVSARAASVSASASIRRRGRNACCCSVSAPASALAASIAKRRQRGEMLGAGLDARGPAPLALAEIGARQQFAERQDAGERGADVVRECGERRLGRPRRRAASRRPASRALCSGLFLELRSHHGSPQAAALRMTRRRSKQNKRQTGLSKIMR